MTTSRLTDRSLPALIAEAGHSQASLARRLGVGESQVSRWCNGLKPGEKNRRRIARLLKVKQEELWPT